MNRGSPCCDNRTGSRAGIAEGGIHTSFKLLAVGVLAIGALAVSASSRAIAQTSGEEAVSGVVQTIQKLLPERRSPGRDDQLYAAAVSLFKSIEAGSEPAARRDLLARALHEVAIGGHANAWIDYGRCLWNGWGVGEDREAAIDAYKHAADLGSDFGAYVAATNLYWTFKRYDEAYAYAERALKGDDPEGAVRYLLGLMAYNGRGRAKDIPESLRLHQEATARGNADALFELFVYAMQGIGDRSKAVFYLQEAGKRDQPRACAESRRALCDRTDRRNPEGPRGVRQVVQARRRSRHRPRGRGPRRHGAARRRHAAGSEGCGSVFPARRGIAVRCRWISAGHRTAKEDVA